jgi:cell division protein FtsN
MKKAIQLFAVLLIGGLMFSACKSQQVITIPNAHAVAGAPAVNQTPVIVSTPPPSQTEVIVLTPPPPVTPVAVQPEEVRDERFTLAAGETNTAAMTQKYHVVVGSFRSQDNARGLQATLNREGNNAVIVVNEQGMFRVLLNSYPTYNEARARILQINRRFSDAWILIQREN